MMRQPPPPRPPHLVITSPHPDPSFPLRKVSKSENRENHESLTVNRNASLPLGVRCNSSSPSPTRNQQSSSQQLHSNLAPGLGSTSRSIGGRPMVSSKGSYQPTKEEIHKARMGTFVLLGWLHGLLVLVVCLGGFWWDVKG
jgi:cobalamin biosynthesis Mg chelatase CobN